MNKKLEEVIRGFAVDFESKVLVAKELERIAEILKAEASDEMVALEARILATRKLLNEDGTVTVQPKAKPEVVIPEPEVIKAKVDEVIPVSEFVFHNKIEIENTKIDGSFKYNRKTYYFTASTNMRMPMVYGAKSMDLIEICKNAISENVDDTFYDLDFNPGDDNVNHEDRYYNDIEREIMIYFAPDGSFKGYFQGKAFVWEPNKFDLPTACSYKNSLDSSKYRKMRNVGQAELIKSLCEELYNKASYLNDVVVPQEKETVKQPEREYYWDEEMAADPDWEFAEDINF